MKTSAFSSQARISILLVVTLLVTSTFACTFMEEPPPTLAPIRPQSTTTPGAPMQPSPVLFATADISSLPEVSGGPTVNPTVQPSISIQNYLAQVDSNRMLNTITRLTLFENRHNFSDPSSTTGIHAARDWLQGEFEAIKNANPGTAIQVYPAPFTYDYNGVKQTGYNIVMVMTGTDGDAGVVLIGAHYDTINKNSPFTPTAQQPAANDNGSGVAAVLEIARIMAQKPRRATVIFILFAAEEVGRKGSIAYAEFLKAQQAPLRGVLSLDTIGSPTGPAGQRFDDQMRAYSAPPDDSTSHQLARLIELNARVYDVGMRVNVKETLDRPGRWGDHQSFSDINYPAVRLIEQMDDPNRGDTHRDTLDDIEPDYLRRVTQVALASMLVLSDGPDAPRLRVLDRENWRLEWMPARNAVAYVVALRSPGSPVYDLTYTTTDTYLQWDQLPNYESVTVAAIDGNGHLGEFAREQVIRP